MKLRCYWVIFNEYMVYGKYVMIMYFGLIVYLVLDISYGWSLY